MSDEKTRKPFLDLSLTQLIGGSAAAATAAALGSRLGLVGTIVGAAAVSVISALAGAVYTQSLRRTQEMIRAREMIGARELMSRVGQRTAARPTLRESAVERNGEPERDVVPREAATAPPVRQRVTWKTVAVTAAVVFLIAVVAITGTELLTGRSFDGSKGTTVSNVVHGGGPRASTPTKTPVPTPTPTTTPTGSPTSLPSRVPLDSISPTATPTTTPSTTPTDVPSSTDSPTAGGSGAAGGATSASPTQAPSP